MSGTIRKKSIIGNGGQSEKKDKQSYNRGYRTMCKTFIAKGWYDDIPKHQGKRHGGNWNFTKDGKRYFDKNKRPELMRK